MADTRRELSDGEGTLTPASGAAYASKGGAAASVDSTSGGDDDTRPATRAPSGYEQDLENDVQRALSRVQSLVVQAVGHRPACFKNTLQEVSFVAQATIAMSTTTFLVGLTSIVTSSIGADLGMSQAEIVWIAAASTLTAGAFQLAVGQMADMLGRKLVYLAGMGSFAVFMLLLGFAKNPYWMDIVLGVLGISSAMVVPPAGGILGAAYEKPSRRKNMAFAAFSAGNPTGFVIGSITCGIATMLFSWRAAFYFVAMLWAVLFLHALWAVPNIEAFSLGQPMKERLNNFVKTFDWLGAVLTLFGTGMLTAGITLGPTSGWSSAVTLCLLIIGIALIVLFLYWETNYAHPMMPPFIWKDRNFDLIVAVTVFGFMAFQATNFYLAYYMQEIRHWSAISIAVHLLPSAIAGLIWNILIGYILDKVNNTLIMAAGAVSYVAANTLLSFLKEDSNYWAFIFPALVLNVVGADFQFNVANMYVMQSLPPKQQGLASGIMNTLIRLSSTLAMGIATAVYSSVELSPKGQTEPMLKFTRTFQVSIALSAFSVLFVPFIRVGTQGHHEHGDVASAQGEVEDKAPVISDDDKKAEV